MVRFGIQTPIEGTTFMALARHWQAAEKLGYDTIWLDDHFHGVVAPASADSPECWVLMSALARETSTIRFGTLVGCNSYRQPSLVAKMASTLDEVSNGRLEFGIGAGWFEQEYLAYGFDFPAVRTRLEQLEEALQIFKLMWTEEQPTFAGRHYKIAAPWCNPKPVQKPYPPIMIGGGGEKVLLRLVAQYADRWNHGGSVAEFRKKLPILEQHCRDVGRDFGAIEKSWFGNIVIEETQEKLDQRLAKRGMKADLLPGIAGTPETVIKRLREYVDVGVTHFIAMFGRVERLGATELFAREVIRAFR